VPEKSAEAVFEYKQAFVASKQVSAAAHLTGA
jgi:hypothetical protein